MRKTIKNSEAELTPENTSWLDVRTIARVEVTSEGSPLFSVDSFIRRVGAFIALR